MPTYYRDGDRIQTFNTATAITKDTYLNPSQDQIAAFMRSDWYPVPLGWMYEGGNIQERFSATCGQKDTYGTHSKAHAVEHFTATAAILWAPLAGPWLCNGREIVAVRLKTGGTVDGSTVEIGRINTWTASASEPGQYTGFATVAGSGDNVFNGYTLTETTLGTPHVIDEDYDYVLKFDFTATAVHRIFGMQVKCRSVLALP